MNLFVSYLIVLFTLIGCLYTTTPTTQDYVLSIENDNNLNIHTVKIEIAYADPQFADEKMSFSSHDKDYKLEDDPIVLQFPIQANKNSKTTVSYTCYSYGITVAEYTRVIKSYKLIENENDNEEPKYEATIEILSDKSILEILEDEDIESLIELEPEKLAEIFNESQLSKITPLIKNQLIAEVEYSSDGEGGVSSAEESSEESDNDSSLSNSDSDDDNNNESSSETSESSELTQSNNSSDANPDPTTPSSSDEDPNDSSSSQSRAVYTITINSGITSTTIEIEEGEKKTISQSPEPSPGYLFREWTSGSKCIITSPKSGNDALIECGGDETIDATFSPITYTISVKKSGPCGSIESNSIEFSTGDSPIDLGITSDDYCNYTIENEQLHLSGNNITGIADEHRATTELEITILFTESTIPSATISFICQVNGTDFNDCPSVSDNLSSIQLKENDPTATKTITAKTGYIFDQMVAGENVTVSGSNITFDEPGQGTVYAKFTRKTYNAKIKSSPASIFTQQNNNVGYRVREQHTAPADPFGYTFDKWEESGGCIVESTQGRIATYYCEGEGEVTAVYEELLEGIFTDERDGSMYTWVKYDDTFWMNQNLHWDSTYCYDQKEYNCNSSGNYYIYRLNNIQDDCPDNWQVPTKQEWENINTEYLINLSSGSWAGYLNANRGLYFAEFNEKAYWWTSTKNTAGYYYFVAHTKNTTTISSNFHDSQTSDYYTVRCIRN